MQINVQQPIMGMKGEPLKDGAPDAPNLTLATVLTTALLAHEDNADAKWRFEKFQLALKIDAAKDTLDGNVDLSLEQIVKLKELVAKVYPTLVMGRVYLMFDKLGEKNVVQRTG